jgi:hypothetical protein
VINAPAFADDPFDVTLARRTGLLVLSSTLVVCACRARIEWRRPRAVDAADARRSGHGSRRDRVGRLVPSVG